MGLLPSSVHSCTDRFVADQTTGRQQRPLRSNPVRERDPWMLNPRIVPDN